MWRKEYKKQNKRKWDIKNSEKQCNKLDLLWKLLLYTRTRHTQEFPKAFTIDYCQNSDSGTPNTNRNHHSASVSNKGWRKVQYFISGQKQTVFGRPKGACSHDMICGKTRNSMQCTQIRVTQMYDLQKLLALEEFRIISRN